MKPPTSSNARIDNKAYVPKGNFVLYKDGSLRDLPKSTTTCTCSC